MKLKGKIKELTALTSAICMLSVPNTTVLAATGTKINSVPLSIESEIEAWDTDSDVTVSTSSSEFDIDDVVITNEPSDEWDDGDKPKLKIILYADDDYYFASGFSKSGVSLSGSDGTVTSVSRSSSDTEENGQSYISEGTDESAVLVSDGANVTLKDFTVNRTSEDSKGGDSSSFYGRSVH